MLFKKKSFRLLSEAGLVQPQLEFRDLEVEGSGLTTVQWTGLGRSEWSAGSGVSAGFALSQTPFVQLTRYGSLGEVLTSLSLNSFCEVRVKLAYPKGS